MQLPSPGDIQGQIQAGQNLAQQIEKAAGPGGDPSGLLSEGIAIAGTAIGGSAGMAISMVGGILAGAAMTGPVGAAIALAGSIAEIASQAFGAGADTASAYGVSKATATISSRIASYGKSVGAGPNFGAPGGWSAADWSAFARPPSSTKNAQQLMSMCSHIFNFWDKQVWSGYPAMTGSDPAAPMKGKSASEWARMQKPLCTPVWFYWTDPSKIVDCDQDLHFGKGGAGGSVATLRDRWVAGTTAVQGLSQNQIVNAAIGRLPDPLYWSSSLYGTVLPSGFSGYATGYFNVDLLNANATVLNMASRGASLQAIISELLIQSYILSVQGGESPSGAKIENTFDIQYGFHQLVDDYLARGQSQVAPTVPANISTAGAVGAVLAGVTGTVLVGILGYSAVTKTSPIETTKLALARAGRLRSRF